MRRLLFPTHPMRAGLIVVAITVILALAAIYLPLSSAAVNVLLVAALVVFSTCFWFLWGPPWRAAYPDGEPPVPSSLDDPPADVRARYEPAEAFCACGHGEDIHDFGEQRCSATEPDRCSCAGFRYGSRSQLHK